MNGPGALVVAFGAGLLSFLLPCTLPLIPGYLSYISGLGAEEIQDGKHRGVMLAAAGLFVLGFSLVFVALGATASYIGSFLLPYRDVLTRISGVFIIIMALFIIGLFRLPFLYREKRLTLGREFGIWSAFPSAWPLPLAGVLASAQYSPRSWPTRRPRERHKRRPAPLLLRSWAGCPLSGARRSGGAYVPIGPLAAAPRPNLRPQRRRVLLTMGVFLMFNQWTQIMAPVMRWYAQTNLPF
jgi:hypothetical protein